LNAAEPLSSIGSIYDVADRLNCILNDAPMFEFIRPHEWLMATDLARRMNKVRGWDNANNNLEVRDINIVGDYQAIAGYRQRHARRARQVFDNGNRRPARAVLCVVHAKMELFKKPPEIEAGLVAYDLQIYAGTENFFAGTGRMVVRVSSPSPAHISDY